MTKAVFILALTSLSLCVECFASDYRDDIYPVLVIDHWGVNTNERIIGVIFSDGTLGRSVIDANTKPKVQGCGFGHISRLEPTEKKVLKLAFDSERQEVSLSLLSPVLDEINRTEWKYDMKRMAIRHAIPICGYALIDSELNGFTYWRLLFHQSSTLSLQLEGLDLKSLYLLFDVP